MSWFALYTKPNCEGQVAFRLKNAGIENLSPRIRVKKYRKNKLVEDIEPLFPCYIFAKFEVERHWHMISYTRGVRYIVGRTNPIPVREEVINAMIERTAGGMVVPELPALNKGDRVRIRGSVFDNFYGLFEKELSGTERVSILLETIGYKVEVDRFFIEKI